jgi:drug/metabolite transporter (DMT)-like permease
MTGLGALGAAGLRCVLAALIAGVWLAARRVPIPERRHWPGLLVVALGCVLGFPVLTALALRTSTSSHSAVVVGVLPLATAVYGTVRARRSPSPVFWIGALAGAAVVLVFTLQQSSGLPTLGDLFLFAALLVCAAGYGEGGRLAAVMPGWQVISWGLLAALPVSVAVAVVGLSVEPVEFGGKMIAGLLYTAVASQLLGLVVWYAGLAAIGVARASQLQLIQPLLTLGWSALLLNEQVGPAALLAAGAVLACIAVTQRARS